MITAVFFTYGVTLAEWQRSGLLARELALYRALVRPGDEVWFFTYDSRIDASLKASVPPGPFRFFPKRGPWRSHALWSLLLPLAYHRELRRTDLFKANQMNGSWSALAAGWLLRRPVLVRQGNILSFQMAGRGASRKARFIYRIVEELAYRLASHTTFPKPEDLTAAGRRRPWLRTRASVLPNHVDIERFRPEPRSKTNQLRLLFVGRLMPQKNPLALLEAVARLPHMEVTLVGRGPLRAEAEARAARADLAGRVRFLDPVSHERLPEMMRAADIFVLPSLYEGLPKVLLEAMASGLAVVAGRVPGIREVVADGETGLLVEPTPEGIGDALRELSHRPALRRRLGAAARRAVAARYALARVATLERRLLDEMLAA